MKQDKYDELLYEEPNGFIGNSSDAYKRIYPSIADAIINGEKVIIKYKTT